MRIERDPAATHPVTAFLDETEARILSRSVHALPDWQRERSGPSLTRVTGGEGTLAAGFVDEAELDAFVLRFLPGKRRVTA